MKQRRIHSCFGRSSTTETLWYGLFEAIRDKSWISSLGLTSAFQEAYKDGVAFNGAVGLLLNIAWSRRWKIWMGMWFVPWSINGFGICRTRSNGSVEISEPLMIHHVTVNLNYNTTTVSTT